VAIVTAVIFVAWPSGLLKLIFKADRDATGNGGLDS